MEFVIEINPEKFAISQILPAVYLREGYNGNDHLYLTGHQGYKFRVSVTLRRNGTVEVHGYKWTQFVSRHFNDGVRVLHFVEEGEDSFYVTGYDAKGIEFGGYEGVRGRMPRYMTRNHTYPNVPQTIDASFLEGVAQNTNLVVLANGYMLQVSVQRVNNGTVQKPNYVYEIADASWKRLVRIFRLEMGMIIVFAKNPFDRLWLMAFDNNGMVHTDVQFHGANRLMRKQLKLEHYEADDDRMKHICQWESHREHYNEADDTFYKPYASTVDKQRLRIKTTFLEKHPMHMYNYAVMNHNGYSMTMEMRMVPHSDKPWRTNHIAVYGKWKKFASDCSFAYDKVIRFRFMHFLNDVDLGELIPVFHLC